MREYTESNSLIMNMKISRVKEMAVVNNMFEELRTKLNQAKADDILIHDDVVLPFVFGMLSEVSKAFIESRNSDLAKDALAKLYRLYTSDVIPWKELVQRADKLHDL